MIRRDAIGIGACAAAIATLGALAQSAAFTPLTEAQTRQVLTHGPWPPTRRNDPSNRASGNPHAIALGAQLFRDPRLSRTGAIACATCHKPDHAFTDGRPRAHGIASADRNTPSVVNAATHRWFGWDGAGDSLWAQSLRPMVDPREMGSDFAHLASLVRSDAALRAGYIAAFAAPPGADDEVVAVDVAKGLAAFLETLVSARTPFDDFRDALARGDRVAAAAYPPAAQRGLAIFVGHGRCNVCHGGPQFSNGEFHDVGIAFFAGAGRVDAGRYDGIGRVQASRYNLLGPFNDDPARRTAIGTRYVALEHRNFGEFKVPSLRNVAQTAPYMHNGSVQTLRDVVRHYSELDVDRLHEDGEAILRPLKLSESEVDDLVAFLESLSDRPAPSPTARSGH